MNVATTRLGIFELIGYLFSGIYVVTAVIAVPLQATGFLAWIIPSLLTETATAAVTLLVFTYAVGIFTSRFSIVYYGGITRSSSLCQKLIPKHFHQWLPEPETNPFKFLQSEAGWTQSNVDQIWGWVNKKLHEIVQEEALKETMDKAVMMQSEKERIEGLYNAFAYASPLVSTIDRIASIARFGSAIVVGSFFCLISFSVLGLVGIVMLLMGSVQFSGIHCLASVVSVAVDLCFLYFGHQIATRSHAAYYWRYVAAGILSLKTNEGA